MHIMNPIFAYLHGNLLLLLSRNELKLGLTMEYSRAWKDNG